MRTAARRWLTGLSLAVASLAQAQEPLPGEVAIPWESFMPFPPESREGLRVAMCAVDGVGYYVVTALGPGAPPLVKLFVYRHAPARLVFHSEWYAYDPAFPGGVTLDCSVVKLPPEQGGGGVLFIITGADAGGGPHGRVWIVYPAP